MMYPDFAKAKIVSALLLLLLVSLAPAATAETYNERKAAAAAKYKAQTQAEEKKAAGPKAPSEKAADSHAASADASHAAEATASEAKSEAKSEARPEAKVSKVLPSDVRVLIDISGSMKKTDPKNLRKSALELIVRLLPDQSKAGIWTFGESVNLLMADSIVDPEWRKQAGPKANEINSVSVFTNIGKALETVAFDRKKPSADYKTHIVLLTDGVVDISKEATDNVKERQRLLNEVLPDLKAAGYLIHTIALSSDADADLLKKISIATDGVSTTAQTADELTDTFLKIFDQAVPAERVPLENNGFLVDASIKEFTALIFRKSSGDKSIIIAPDGAEFSTTSAEESINWYRTDTYDLITVQGPKVGQWKIKTEITPQSRVTIVSNLRLVVEPLKTNLRLNESVGLSYSFLENDATITNKDFLGLLEASAVIKKADGGQNDSLDLTMPPPEDGIYRKTLSVMKDPGDYVMQMYIDGKTFKREFKYSFSVIGSLLTVAKNNVAAPDNNATHNYKITLDQRLVNLKKAKVSVTIKDSNKNTSNKILTAVDGKFWEFSFLPSQPADYTVSISAEGEMLDGTPLNETLEAETFTYKLKADEKPAAAPAAKPEEKASGESHLVLYIGIGLGTLLLGAVAFFGYRLFAGDKSKDEFSEVEKTITAVRREIDKKDLAEKKPVEQKIEMDLKGDSFAETAVVDDLMSENAFPLDNMEDTNKDEPNN